MRDRRPVDELSIEELERILAIRKREQRMQRLQRLKQDGRVMHAAAAPAEANPQSLPVQAATPAPVQKSPAAPPRPVPQTSEPRFEDDLFTERPPDDPERAAQRKSAINRILLVVEIAAVVGLLFLGTGMIMSISALEQETRAAQELANQQRSAGIPTPQPTSILTVRIEDYVLPGGHVIEADDTVRFNLEEFIDDVPAHLRVAVQQQVLPVNIVRPPETPETARSISIPRLNLDQSIVQGTDWEALKEGVGQVQNGAYPAAATGNVVLAAHNDIYGELFRDLDQMRVGDEFTVRTNSRTFVYRVREVRIVDPTDTYVMDDQGVPTVTLISCYPYRVNNKRYIVVADRVDNAGA
ncbi:MAG: sortase [Chloroflexi bacterium]|nr:sortase [Chloroflexota bacterium]